MTKVPDYREIEVPMTLKSLRNYVEPLLHTSGMLQGKEEIVGLSFLDNLPDTFMVKVCIKKPQELVVINN
jgi:hypothetical protein